VDVVRNSQPSRNGRRNLVGRARVRVRVSPDVPLRINLDKYVGQCGLVQDPSAERPLDLVFGTEVRNEDQWRRPTRDRKVCGRPQHFARDGDAALNGIGTSIRHEKFPEPSQAGVVPRRLPREAGADMRPVVVEIPPEERRHEQRHDRQRVAKARQLGPEPHVRLIVPEAVDRQIRGLDSRHHADLGRYRLVPGQSEPEHRRFSDEHNRRTAGIDWFVKAADAITGRIERVIDRAAANGAVTGACGDDGPAESHVGATQRLFIRFQPFDRPQVHAREDDLARD